MKPLYELVTQYRALEQLSADDYFDPQALADTLEGLGGEIEIKARNIAAHVLNIDAYAQAAKDASKKLAERAKRMERRAAWFRDYLHTHMVGAGITKIEGPEFTISRRKNPPSVVIEDAAEIPEEFLQPPDPMVDRIVEDAIKAQTNDLKEGEDFRDYVVLTKRELREIVLRHMPPRPADKKKLADALKAGQEVPGCRLEQSERLEIKQ